MKRRQKVIAGCLAVVSIVGIIGGRIYTGQKQRQAMAESVQQVETVQVTKQNLLDAISVTGTINSAEVWDVSASAKDVKVLEVRYEVGDYVEKGEVVAVLDSSSIERSLTEAKNRQALSEYTENKSIQTATENYQEAVEDGSDSYQKAVKNEAEAKEALQEAEGDLSDAAERLKRREERLSEAKTRCRRQPNPRHQQRMHPKRRKMRIRKPLPLTRNYKEQWNRLRHLIPKPIRNTTPLQKPKSGHRMPMRARQMLLMTPRRARTKISQMHRTVWNRPK